MLDSKSTTDDLTIHDLVLVQWDGLPVEFISWEDIYELQQACPCLHLEDKVTFQAGRNDIQ